MSEDSPGGEGGRGATGGNDALFDQPELMTFSVVPDIEDGIVHAVMDWMIRAVFLDPGLVKLRAVCGTEVRPDSQLRAGVALCGGCRDALPDNAIPRPGQGSPMLRALAQLQAELIR